MNSPENTEQPVLSQESASPNIQGSFLGNRLLFPILFGIFGLVFIAAVGWLVLSPKSIAPKKPITPDQSAPVKVVCKRFTNLEEALQNIEIACVLDLSDKKIAHVPATITTLTKLNVLSLKNNSFSTFPVEIANMTSLVTLDLSNNQITTFPNSLSGLQQLQILIVTGNNISEVEKNRIKQLLPTTNITF